MMTNDQRVRFIAAISRRENLGKETQREKCGAGKPWRTEEMPGRWDSLNHEGKENERIRAGYEKIKQEFGFCSCCYHYFCNESKFL